MKYTVSNYRGIERAEIDIDDGVTLVAGHNGQGKSSTAEGLASLLSGNPLPPGIELKKTEMQQLVKRGAKEGSLRLVTQGGTQSIEFPSGRSAGTGHPLEIGGTATGSIRFTGMDDKNKAKLIQHFLKSEPTDDDLRFAMSEKGVESELVRVAGKVKAEGWDAAHKYEAEIATRSKGAWTQVTKRNYGSKIAEDFVPENYDKFELENLVLEDTKASLAEAEQDLRLAIEAKAVAGSRFKELQVLAGTLDDVIMRQLAADKAAKKADEEFADFNKMVRPVAPQTMECPHCRGEVALKAGKLEKVESDGKQPSAASIKRKQEEHDQRLADIQKRRMDAFELVNKLKNERADVDAAQTEIESMTGEISDLTPEQAEQRVQEFKGLIVAHATYMEARKIALTITRALEIALILAPNGLRQIKLANSIGVFNNELDGLCAAAKWRRVIINDDLSVTYGGTNYQLLSESERYRADTVLKVGFAKRAESPVVICDGADILDSQGRMGLVTMLHKSINYSLVCMTISDKKLVPDLFRAQMGRTYWVESGVVSELIKQTGAA